MKRLLTWAAECAGNRLCWIFPALLALVVNSNGATLQWDRNAESDVEGYRVYYGVGSRAYTNTIDVGDTNMWPITGLQVGTQYFFAVTAYTSTGLESDYSTELSYTSPVQQTNRPPTITSVPNQTINWNTATAQLPFTIGDADTNSGSLTVTATSSNVVLVPNGNITLGGNGSNRTVRVMPATNQFGTTRVTLTVSDGALSSSSSFLLTVNQVNTAPSISSIANQSTTSGTTVGPLAFVVGDGETSASSLTLTRSSANQSLIPLSGIVFGGSGSNRTVSVTPATGATGTGVVTVAVSDGTLNASRNFSVVVSAANTAPTISSIPNQSTTSGATVGPISFTVGDADTAASSLTLTRTSGNLALIPLSGIVFGGSGSNRNVSVTPAANGTGTGVVTVAVSDGSLTASKNFSVIVSAPNTAPIVSQIADQTTTVGGTVGPLDFTIEDAQTPASNLVVQAFTSNEALFPTNGIVLGGVSSNRTISLTAAAGATGTGFVSIAVSDGSLVTSNMFAIAVLAQNTAPTLSAIANQNTVVGAQVGPLEFQVNDTETPASNLVVAAYSMNEDVIASNDIEIDGNDDIRTLTLTPLPGVTGTGTVVVAVSDGSLWTSNSFRVVVSEPTGDPSTWTFTSSNAITIPRRGGSTPYPSTIEVSGVTGAVGSVTLTLSGFAHTWPDDVDILLSGPSGVKVVVLSDLGGGVSATNINLTLSDYAVDSLPDSGPLQSGTFKPTNVGSRDSFPAPAPAGPYLRGLTNFAGTSANGSWFLYVVDDGRGDAGSIDSWSLTFGPANVGIPPIGTNEIGGILDPEAKDPRVTVSGLDASGCVVLAIEGVPSQKYRVEASTDLAVWSTVGSLTLETTDATVSDCQGGAMRFYRLVEDWEQQ